MIKIPEEQKKLYLALSKAHKALLEAVEAKDEAAQFKASREINDITERIQSSNFSRRFTRKR